MVADPPKKPPTLADPGPRPVATGSGEDRQGSGVLYTREP
jgi:hypothetical protein